MLKGLVTGLIAYTNDFTSPQVTLHSAPPPTSHVAEKRRIEVQPGHPQSPSARGSFACRFMITFVKKEFVPTRKRAGRRTSSSSPFCTCKKLRGRGFGASLSFTGAGENIVMLFHPAGALSGVRRPLPGAAIVSAAPRLPRCVDATRK